MAHTHILSGVEWALTFLNGMARARRRGRVSQAVVLGAAEYARRMGASKQQIESAVSAPNRLRY